MTDGSGQPVALVTGGAKRVGAVIVNQLAQRGYRVAIHARHSILTAEATAAALRSQGQQAIAVAADVRDEQSVGAMVDRMHEHFGRIDALVNCAAIWSPRRLEEVTAESVRENFDVNTLGTFLCCRKVGLVMAGQPQGGAIVNLGDWAIARPYLNYAAYFPSKGAIPAMTRMFAVELAHRNPQIRVNAVLPGPVMLPPDLPAAEREAAIAATLVRREGRPENVSDAVLALLENDFITGVCLPVDGGRTIFTPTSED